MNNKNYLQEEFVTYKRHQSMLFGVYEKPTKSEIQTMIKEEEIKPIEEIIFGKQRKFYSFRFIAEKSSKKIYLFNYHFLHEYASEFLLDHKFIKSSSFNDVTKGFINFDIDDKKFTTYNFGEQEWSFIKKYINSLNGKKNLTEEFYTYQKTRDKEFMVEIFKNPTFSELFDERKKDYSQYYLEDEKYRTIIDVKNQNIYIFHGALLHEPVVDLILKKEKNISSYNLLVGFVSLKPDTRKIVLTFVMRCPYFTSGKNISDITKKEKKYKEYDFMRKYFSEIKDWD